MKKISFLLIASLVAVNLGLWSARAAADQDAVRLSEAWALVMPRASTGAVYLSITNTGTLPDELTGATTPIAAKAELDENKIVNGVLHRRSLKSVAIAPGKTVVFAPDGKHIVLIGLQAQLRKGNAIPLTLTFAHAGDQHVSALITGVETRRHPG